MSGDAVDDRLRHRRHPERGAYDQATVAAIFDEALWSTLAVADDTGPRALPMFHARVDDMLYLHGSPASQLLRSAIGAPVCVTATLVDGIVLARSWFNHSLNYRSAVVLGTARKVTDPDERARSFAALADKAWPGRAASARPPTVREDRATLVVAVPLDRASTKVRTGPPVDDTDDLTYPVWAGVVPVETTFGDPIPAPDLRVPAPPPDARSV